MTQLYDGWLRGTGVNVNQLTLLLVLLQHGDTPLTQAALGEMLAIDSTTLTRTLAPLIARRWIKHRPGADRRARQWTITAAGRRAFERAQPRWSRAQNELRSRLGDEHWESLFSELTIAATAAVKKIAVRPRQK